jgi:hypothetical protein
MKQFVDNGTVKGKIKYGHALAESEIAEMVTVAEITNHGSNNVQWYTLKWHKPTGAIAVIADNSGDCYGEYFNHYYSSLKAAIKYNRPDEPYANNIISEFVDTITEESGDPWEFYLAFWALLTGDKPTEYLTEQAD